MSESDSEDSSDQEERKYGTAIKMSKRSTDKGSRMVGNVILLRIILHLFQAIRIGKDVRGI